MDCGQLAVKLGQQKAALRFLQIEQSKKDAISRYQNDEYNIWKTRYEAKAREYNAIFRQGVRG